MATRKKSSPKTFKAAYLILKDNATDLQNSTEPDIDNLMTMVEESIDAYKVCQARIEAVQQALDAAFNKDVDKEVEIEESEKDVVVDTIDIDDE